MLPISIRGIICGLSNCGKTNVLICLLESPHTSKSLQSKYRYLVNLMTDKREIGYFTYFINSDIVSPNKTLPNFIIFDNVACNKQDAIRKYISMGRLLWPLSDIRKNSEASYTRQRESLNSFQTRWYQPKTHVQQSRKHRHVLRGFLRIVSQLMEYVK